MERRDLVTIRDGVEADNNFILATWLRGLYYGSPFYSQVPKDIFMKNYHKKVTDLLTKATVKIACLVEDPDVILGYSVSRQDALDFIFVKTAWRKIGVGRSLLTPAINKTTHLTKVGAALKPKEWVFNPFL